MVFMIINFKNDKSMDKYYTAIELDKIESLLFGIYSIKR
jgi:hypothetical protein